MTRARFRAVRLPMAVVLCLLVQAGLGAGQARPTTLTLSQSNGPPGAIVTVPVYFSAADGVRAGRIALTVEFPVASLAFAHAELSGLSEGVGVTIETRVEASGDGGRATLHVTLSAAGGGDAPESIPDGPIVYLGFRTADSTTPGTLIALVPTLGVTTLDDPPRPVDPVAAPEGQIVVSEPGVSSCFFYMH